MDRTWVRTVFQPLIVAAMMACLAVSVVQVLQLFVPTWSGAYLTFIVFVSALEAVAANRLVRRRRLRGKEMLAFRAGEWLLILAALKLGSYTARGLDALLTDFALWQTDLAYLLTIEYIIAIFLTVFTWVMSTEIERDLSELAKPNLGVRINRDQIYSTLVGQFFWGGIILLFAAGVARIGVVELTRLSHPKVTGIILNALLYFVLGLLLLSQARLTALQARWQVQQIPTVTDIGSRWSRTTLAFILLLGVLAVLLPTSYTFGLIESLGMILGYILYVGQLAIGLLLFLVTLPFALLLRLLFGNTGPLDLSRAEPPPPMPAPPPSDASGPSILAILRSLIFWGLTIGIVVYALRSYFRYRGDLVGEVQADSWLGRLLAFLTAWWRRLRQAAGRTIEVTRRRLAEVRPRGVGAGELTKPWRWRRLSSMSPRERIQYYYLSIVHRGKKVGRPRQKSETPQEYSASLRQTKPEVEPDLTELTGAFIEARYSHHDVTDEQAGLLRQSWNRIKRALRS